MRLIFVLLIYCITINSYAVTEEIYISEDVFFKKSNFKNFENWNNENYKEALDVLIKSCKVIKNLPNNKNIFPQSNKKITKNDFYATCKIANIIKNYNDKYIQTFFENYFIPYKVVDNKTNSSLFTGYYLPQINVKREKDDIFKYPIYKRAENFENNGKYYTREEINNGILDNRNLEILYTDDIVELFFLHIQGSGNAYLIDENKIISIGYDGKNNYKFTSIGKYMQKYNLLEQNETNSKDIKSRLKQDLEFAQFIMNKNKSYIFFKILNTNTIKGAFGMELVPFRTIAVDKNYIPFGFPLWLETKHTLQNTTEDFNKIVIANDTGSAMNGAIRGDIFFGSGTNGENNASFQYSGGQYYILIPLQIAKKL